MPAKAWKNRQLVIDTDVLVNASDSTVSNSVVCRRFLDTVLDTGYYVVQTPTLRREWDKNATHLNARRWLATLERKGKIIELEDSQNEQLRDKIGNGTFSPKERESKARAAMLKDVHLVEAALKADKNISSCDNVREFFALVSAQIKDLEAIVWVNPLIEQEEPLDWLRTGAKADKKRQLKAFREKLLNIEQQKGLQ